VERSEAKAEKLVVFDVSAMAAGWKAFPHCKMGVGGILPV